MRFYILFITSLAILSSCANHTNDNHMIVEYYIGKPFSGFRVDGTIACKDMDSLRAVIGKQKKKRVIFRSYCKLTKESEDEFCLFFESCHVRVIEFWIPTSQFPNTGQTPGWINIVVSQSTGSSRQQPKHEK
jgi:hypothetical protein